MINKHNYNDYYLLVENKFKNVKVIHKELICKWSSCNDIAKSKKFSRF